MTENIKMENIENYLGNIAEERIEKLKIVNFKEQLENSMIFVSFDKNELFLKRYKDILREMGMEIKSERNPLYKDNLEDGINFSCYKSFDLEIIYLPNFIAWVVRYKDNEAKNLFMRSLYKYAE